MLQLNISLDFLFFQKYTTFLTRYRGWQEMNTRGCYSLVKINLAPLCAWKTVDEYDIRITVRLVRMTSQVNGRDFTVISQKRQSLAKRVKLPVGGLFSAGLCIQGIRWTVRNKIMKRLPGITIFVTHSKNSFFTVIHTSFYIIAWYVWHLEIIIRCLKWQNSALIQTRLPVIFSAVSSCFFVHIRAHDGIENGVETHLCRMPYVTLSTM